MNKVRLALFSLAVTAIGWLLVVPRIEAVAVTTKVGYAAYCSVIAIAIGLYLLVALRIRNRMRGSAYALLGVVWVFIGWVLTYVLAVAFTSGIVAAASSSAYLSVIPVGLPVADLCAASATKEAWPSPQCCLSMRCGSCAAGPPCSRGQLLLIAELDPFLLLSSSATNPIGRLGGSRRCHLQLRA